MTSPRQDRLRALGRRIADEQDELLAESERALTAAASPVQRRARRSEAQRRALFAAGAVALVATLLLVWLRTRPLEVTLAGRAGWSVGETVETGAGPLTARFSDDSQLELAPRARARLLALTGRGAALRLESGGARVSITPDRHGVWTLYAGRFAVHVTGTRFELDYDARDEQLAVRMHEGKVLVTGCALAAPEPLAAGESLRAACRAGAAQLTRDGAPVPRSQDAPEKPSVQPGSQQAAAQESALAVRAAAPDPRETRHPQAAAIPMDEGAPGTAANPGRSGLGRQAEPPSVPPKVRALPTPAHPQSALSDAADSSPTATTKPTLSWQQLARAGKFEAAYALGRTVERSDLSIADLLLFGDTARLSTEATAALAAYAEVRRRDPGSAAAAVAAFASGRVQFDQRAAFPEAARWFETYLRERAGGPLAREAHGRLVEALERAGEHAAARRSAEQYLRSYPSGPHATFARTLLTPE